MDFALPLLFVVAVWWLSTLVLLHRTGLNRRSYSKTLVAAGIVAAVGVYAVLVSRNNPTPASPYIAFVGALAIWAFHETSYLLGFVSGPRPLECPSPTTTFRRFVYGVQTCLYHEVAILVTAGLLAAITWDAPLRVALWTFVIVWMMRWSAKLNIFLGVRNLHREFWPDHLQYLRSYTRERSMNSLFPWSIAIAAAFLVFLVLLAVSAVDDPVGRTSAMLLCGLLALAMLEHFFLMYRIPDAALWRIATRARDM